MALEEGERLARFKIVKGPGEFSLMLSLFRGEFLDFTIECESGATGNFLIESGGMIQLRREGRHKWAFEGRGSLWHMYDDKHDSYKRIKARDTFHFFRGEYNLDGKPGWVEEVYQSVPSAPLLQRHPGSIRP